MCLNANHSLSAIFFHLLVPNSCAQMYFLFTVQQKLKEEREAKRQSMDGRHQFVINTMVSKVNMEPSEVEEFLLEGDQVGSLLARRRSGR